MLTAGPIYGPQKGKLMNLFVDDLQLPSCESAESGIGSVSEVCVKLMNN